ncbi:MAG: photosynthetic complex putative assembly protein PuhB [Labilithrix sp.]
MSAHDEIDIEPVPGLPEELPQGEAILWQGRPEWRALAQQTFKIRWVAIYFLVFVAARVISAVQSGEGAMGVVRVASVCGLALVCLGGLALAAWLYARSTVYTITTRRVVMRIGVAIPVTWNIPFKRIAAADVLVRDTTDGDITLQLAAPNRIAWLHLWPHVQPWHYVKARPAFRAISEPRAVADTLAKAVAAWSSNASGPTHKPIAPPIQLEATPALATEAVH